MINSTETSLDQKLVLINNNNPEIEQVSKEIQKFRKSNEDLKNENSKLASLKWNFFNIKISLNICIYKLTNLNQLELDSIINENKIFMFKSQLELVLKECQVLEEKLVNISAISKNM